MDLMSEGQQMFSYCHITIVTTSDQYLYYVILLLYYAILVLFIEILNNNLSPYLDIFIIATLKCSLPYRAYG